MSKMLPVLFDLFGTVENNRRSFSTGSRLFSTVTGTLCFDFYQIVNTFTVENNRHCMCGLSGRLCCS